MRTILLTTALLMATTILQAQVHTDSTKKAVTDNSVHYINLAGDNLIKFSTQAQLGISLEVLGSFLMVYSGSLRKDSENKVLLTGIAMSVSGFIVYFTAWNKTRKAGHFLRNYHPSSEGIGIAIPIKHKQNH